MPEKTVLNAARFFEKCLKETGLNMSRLVVFGSHAKGTARKDSDIDILLISKDFRGKDILERARMTGEPEILTIRKFVVPLDIITLTPEELKNSLISDYAKKGIVIFPKTPRRNARKKAASG